MHENGINITRIDERSGWRGGELGVWNDRDTGHDDSEWLAERLSSDNSFHAYLESHLGFSRSHRITVELFETAVAKALCKSPKLGLSSGVGAKHVATNALASAGSCGGTIADAARDSSVGEPPVAEAASASSLSSTSSSLRSG